MTTEGPRFPGTIASDATGTAWSNAANLGADDGADASVTLAAFGFSRTLTLDAFGFTDIPDDATVDGLSFHYNECTDSTGGSISHTSASRILIAGVATGDALTGGFTGFGGTFTLGGASSLFSIAGLTGADIKHADFGLTLRVQDLDGDGGTLDIDAISITVHYTEAVDPADRNRRASSISIGLPWRSQPPLPDGALDTSADRGMIAGFFYRVYVAFRGLFRASPPPVVGKPSTRWRDWNRWNRW